MGQEIPHLLPPSELCSDQLGSFVDSCWQVAGRSFLTSEPTPDSMAETQRTLDAVFIPTNRASSISQEALEGLSSVTDNVIVLPTVAPGNPGCPSASDNAIWLDDLPYDEMQKWFLSLPSSNNPSQRFAVNYDLPLKRNIALHIARCEGMQKICLLDDDIEISVPQVRQGEAALSKDAPLSGYYVTYFPDVSTIDHIHSIVLSIPPKTLPGGNCLFLKVDEVHGFFPYIYNEDWLFVLSNATQKSFSVLGTVKQRAHLPWNDMGRIAFEEFGEVIITGILENEPEAAALYDATYWAGLISERDEWLSGIIQNDAHHSWEQQLCFSRSVLSTLKASECAEFMIQFDQEMRGGPLWLPHLKKQKYQSMRRIR